MIQYDLDKSNAELALDYGFVESNPRRNSYTLMLEIAESDPFYGDKLDIAECNGLSETAYFDIVLGQPLPAAMLPYLRLAAIGGVDAFLLESIFRNTIWGHLELPVSRANEELICQVIQDACKSALSGYLTTIEEVSSHFICRGATVDAMFLTLSVCCIHVYLVETHELSVLALPEIYLWIDKAKPELSVPWKLVVEGKLLPLNE